MQNYFNPRQRLFLSFLAGFSIGWIAHLSRAELILAGSHNYLQVLSLMGFGYCAFLLWFRFRSEIPRLPMTNFKVIGFVLLTVMMLLINSAYIFQYTRQLVGAVAKDLYPIVCILCAPALGLFTRRERLVFGGVFTCFLLIAVFTILRVNVNVVAMAANRAEAFEEVGVALVYSYQVAIGTVSAYLLLYFITTVRTLWISLVCSGGLMFWLYTSLVYSKRQGIMEFVIVGGVLAFILVFEKQIKRIRLYLFVGLGFVLLGGAVAAFQRADDLGVMYNRVIERFQSIRYGGIGNVDRFQESMAYFNEASVFDVIFGKGIGGLSFDIISMFTIHVGWVNLIFKGGIFLALFYLIALWWNIIYVVFQRGFPNKLIVLFFSAYLMFRLLYSPGWGFLPSMLFVGVSFFAPEIFLASEKLRAREFAQARRQRPAELLGPARPYRSYR